MRFLQLMAIYALWNLGWILGAGLFEVFLFGQGVPLGTIYLANSMWFVAGLLTVPFIRGFRTKTFMLAGMLVSIAAILIISFFPLPMAAFAFRLAIGITHILFWAPFNTMFYQFGKGNNATLGALYYAVGPVLSLFAPTVAGFIAGILGFPALYLTAILVFVSALVLTALFVEDRKFDFDFFSAIREVSGLRSLIFMEGFSAAVIVSVTLPIMLLLFADTPLAFGGFTSLATLFSVLAAFFTANLSDKMKVRRSFLLPVAAAFALASILTSQAIELSIFFIGFALVNFFSRIFFPLPLALAVDNSKFLAGTMLAREFILNAGRLCGALAGYFLISFSDIRLVLLVQGLVLLLYIPLFENRKKKLAIS